MLYKLLNLFYRIVAPNHPRGWLEFHSVEENGKLWIHSHGMEKWKLPNIEFKDIPIELSGFAHGIAMELTNYLKNTKVINSGEHLGGHLVSENQIAIHYASFHKIERKGDTKHSGLLRIVDYKQDLNSGFPFKLFSAHLISLSELKKNPHSRIELLEKAIKIYPVQYADMDEIEKEYEYGMNLNNFSAYWAIGDAYLDMNDLKGFEYIENAIAKCPSWAKAFINDFQSQKESMLDNNIKQDPRIKFWNEMNITKIKEITKSKSSLQNNKIYSL